MKIKRDINAGYFLQVHVQCPEKSHELHDALLFLLEIMKM